jgi:polysaccharide export outer membrane protein
MFTHPPRGCPTARFYLPALAAAALGLLLLSGCTFLPSSGPSGYMIRNKAGKSSYELIPINAETLDAIRRTSGRADFLAAGGRKSDRMFGPRGLQALEAPLKHTIALGDVLSVAIFETDSALFRPALTAGGLAASPVTALPPQVVDETGDISIPFVGRIKVLGRLPSDVETDIRRGLQLKTPDPQVVVTVIDRKGGDLISIAGDVRQPSQIPASLAGTRLLDAIARVGGTPEAPHDIMVSVTRGRTTRSDPLQEVYDSPAKNIMLQAGDTVVLRKRALSFMAFGSTGRVGAFPLPMEDLSLANAVAVSGGPADMQADPSGIYVYREEPVALLSLLGRNPPSSGATSPVIYQLNLHSPEGFFYASNFTVRDRDIIYYGAAGSTGVRKFMGLINTFLAPAIGGAGAAASVSILTAP